MTYLRPLIEAVSEKIKLGCLSLFKTSAAEATIIAYANRRAKEFTETTPAMSEVSTDKYSEFPEF